MKPSELFNDEDETKELRTLWIEYKAAQKQHGIEKQKNTMQFRNNNWKGEGQESASK